MRLEFIAATLAVVLALPLQAAPTRAAPDSSFNPAHSFVASNGLRVYPTGPNQFTVPYQNALHATDYLCAAGDFVQRGLGMRNKTRIYRESPAPREPGRGIVFTLDKAKAVPLKIVTSFGGDGDPGISAGAANGNYCSMFFIFDR